MRGEALRKTAARLQELASGAALGLTAADSSLMQIDRDYTKLHAEVRLELDNLSTKAGHEMLAIRHFLSSVHPQHLAATAVCR